jgi:3-hydroxybutyryl-CoA dehydratase
MIDIRNKTIEGLKTGDHFSISRTFTEQDMLSFATITRDYNPVHFDDRFSQAKNFRGRICHGLLVGSMLTEIGGQIGVLASRMDFSFKRPVYFGDTITCVWTFTDIDPKGRARAEVDFRNQDGAIVISVTCKGIIPNLEERAILKAMVDDGDPTNK